MTKPQPVPQKKEVPVLKTISGKALNPLKCKKMARSILKPSQYHRFEIVGKDGTQDIIGGSIFVHKVVGDLPKKVTLKLEIRDRQTQCTNFFTSKVVSQSKRILVTS